MTVVRTSCADAGAEAGADAGAAPWLVGTAGELPPDSLVGGVGFAVHRVQTVITLVTYTVEVVKPVVTIWLPPDEMVEVKGQTVVYEVMVSVVTISEPPPDDRLGLDPAVELAPDDSVLEVIGAELLVRG